MFNNERHNVVNKEINKTALISSDNKRMQSIDFIKIYAYRTRKNIKKRLNVTI